MTTTGSDLIVAATVGTAHRSVDVAALTQRLRPEPIDVDPAAALLDAAALSAVARRTVLLAVPHAAGPPAQPVSERLPVVPDVVRQVLSRVANQDAILVEALTLIRRAGLRLPPELVPGLLDDTRVDVVAATRPVTGQIGHVLMTKNPRWTAPAAPDPDDRTVWDEGTSAQRLEWFRALRRADPAAARNLLADNYSRENVGNRVEFLGALADGLSGADQDFLLTAVGDRSRAVAAAAMTLLTGLPDSPLRRDMRTLAARHLTIGRRLLRATVTVTDLRAGAFAPWPIPEGDQWTALLGRIDPAEWPQVFGGDLLNLIAAGSEDLKPLYPGFRQAAITFRHAGLAQVLIAGTLARGDRKNPPTVDGALWGVLNPAGAITMLDRLLGHQLVRPDQVATAALALRRPWHAALARRYARWLPTGAASGAPAPRQLWDLWATAPALPDCREMADLARSAMTDATGDHGPALTTRASNAANLLTLRAVLYETLPPENRLYQEETSDRVDPCGCARLGDGRTGDGRAAPARGAAVRRGVGCTAGG